MAMTTLRRFFLYSVLFLGFTQSAHGFAWPFNTDEFKKKLSSEDLRGSTRYYARGPSYLTGQKWDEPRFLKQLEQQNYRIRDSEQVLMAGDAKKLSIPQCRMLVHDDTLSEAHTCWMWQTQAAEHYLTVVDSQQIIVSTWQGSSPEPYWKASLDPVLIAQYKGQQPIMQNELKIADFPVNCMNAVMAIEDSEFLEHSGLSYLGLARSLVKNIYKGRYAQGGSTITQQVVKNYFLTPEKTLKRKLTELYLAIKLESEWNKDQILETYLNIIYMGQYGAFRVMGFGAASQYYFNKQVQKLNLAECSLLAAIVNNPGVNNPWKHPEQARTRRNLVLSKMTAHKLISEQEFKDATTAALPPPSKAIATETAPYFFDAVQKELTLLNLTDTARSIFTSLDLEAQQKAQAALQNHISDLEKNKKILIKNKERGFKLEGLVLSSENQTGLVNALVGGQNFRLTQFNRALQGHRQIGSLIKPFVYLSALIYGLEAEEKPTPLTQINDVRFQWKYDGKVWSPENYEHKFNGDVPLYFALKESLNSPAAQVAQKVGIEKIIDVTRLAGFTSKMELTPATSLGASQHYPVEVLEAYRTLANLGLYTKSHYIEKVKNLNGETVYEFKPAFEKRFNDADVAVMVGMMKETLKSGTAKSSKALGWTAPAAGKTGTTSDNHDAWFAGFTPFQTSLVWLGYDQSLSSQLTGGSGGLPVWISLMKNYSQTWPESDFKFPDTVERREVDLHGTAQKTELIFKKQL